jgi:hypothetical protein
MMTKTTMILMALLLAAPVVVATGTTLNGYGYVTAYADATTRVDASGAMRAVEDARDEVETRVVETAESADESRASTQASVEWKADETQDATTDAQQEAQADADENADAYVSWTHDADASAGSDAAEETDMETMPTVRDDDAGRGSVEVAWHLHSEPDAQAQYDLPPPPEPQLGFFESIKIAITALFSFS